MYARSATEEMYGGEENTPTNPAWQVILRSRHSDSASGCILLVIRRVIEIQYGGGEGYGAEG